MPRSLTTPIDPKYLNTVAIADRIAELMLGQLPGDDPEKRESMGRLVTLVTAEGNCWNVTTPGNGAVRLTELGVGGLSKGYENYWIWVENMPDDTDRLKADLRRIARSTAYFSEIMGFENLQLGQR